jgi:hypothetical protein
MTSDPQSSSIYIYKSESMFVGMFEVCLFLFKICLFLLLCSGPCKANKVVISFGSVPRRLLGSDNNEVAFYFWSVPRLLPEEEDVRCYLLSERPHESVNILDKSPRIAKG